MNSNKPEHQDTDFLKGLAGLAAYTNSRSIHPEKEQGKIISLENKINSGNDSNKQESNNSYKNLNR